MSQNLQVPQPHSPTKHPPTLSSTKLLLNFIRTELNLNQCPTLHPPDPLPDDEEKAGYYRRREKIWNYVQIPKELEKLMGYGFFQCADAFLYVFTFLPMRCLISLRNCVRGYICNTPVYLKPSDKCELLKIVILLICSALFMYIDTNVLYHVIKSQSVIKLYIFFNMLEVGDRLFSSFSQDSLDALFITATEIVSEPVPPSPSSCSSPTKNKQSHKKLSTTAHALICGVSILGHALVILLQSTTLSVAINANNRALLTVMMSNNFVELKGSVFKKFDKMNLFQVCCSDIRERFHLFVLLLIVCLQTLREYNWEESRFWVLLPDCLMVMLAEIGVDWIKHAFITRFNELPLQVYEHYTRSLAYDMAESIKKKAHRGGFECDSTDVVGRRLGFIPLPLAIVLIRVVTPMWRSNEQMMGILLLSFMGYIGLASFRILNMIVLVGKAVKIIDEHHSCQLETPLEATERRGSVGANSSVKNSILKRSRTISGSDGDLLKLVQQNEKVDKKLQFEDDLKSEEKLEALGKIHLFANSNVSLNSVGFNEEMLKVEAQLEEEGLTKIERKHSLGSNLHEGVLLGTTTGGDGLDKVEPDPEEEVFKQEDDLNITVIEQSGDEDDQTDEQVKVEGNEATRSPDATSIYALESAIDSKPAYALTVTPASPDENQTPPVERKNVDLTIVKTEESNVASFSIGDPIVPNYVDEGGTLTGGGDAITSITSGNPAPDLGNLGPSPPAQRSQEVTEMSSSTEESSASRPNSSTSKKKLMNWFK